MGCCTSHVFHEEEKGLDDHLFPYLAYAEQPEDEYKQLDTENDQKGDTAVEHIFKKTKMVYGQPPKDMRNIQIDWKEEYNIDLRNRPCPYDFPAFEGDKPPDYDEKKREMNASEKDISGGKGDKKVKGTGRSDGTGPKKSDGGKGKKKKTRRAGADLDECSISDK